MIQVFLEVESGRGLGLMVSHGRLGRQPVGDR